MKQQRGHFDLSFLGWAVGAVGIVLACGGVWLIVLAVRMLTS